MKLTIVDQLPTRHKQRTTPTVLFIENFMNTDGDIARLSFTKEEYTNASSCYSSMRRVCKRLDLPVKVAMYNGEVYLIKRKQHKEGE